MANSATFAKKFIPMLDEVYKNASLTAALDGADELARQGASANEMVIPMLKMQGMADYDPNSGYVQGDVTLTNQTVPCNYDRGRMFAVDTVEDEATAGLYFGRVAGEFIRTRVAPELDAFRFAAYAQAKGVTKQLDAGLSTGAAVLTALRTATTKMDEAEVPMEDRHLFITPTLYGLVADLDTTKSRAVLDRFASVTLVPQSRFYTKIDLTASGEGGFKKAASGGEINFMILHREALIQFEKHVAPKIVSPEQNQTADAYKFGYRCVSIAQVYENKAAGVYVSHKAEA